MAFQSATSRSGLESLHFRHGRRYVNLVPHRCRRVLWTGLILGVVVPWTGLAAQRPAARVFARLVTPNVVELIDPVSGAGRRIYQASSWSTTDLTVSPTGAYLGLLEVQAGIIEGVNYRVPPRAELVVLDTAGAVVRRVAKDVINYTWCGSACLAFIRGWYSENELHDPTGAFVFSLATGTLHSIPLLPQHLTWAPFDSSVYFGYGDSTGWHVRRYHLPNGPLEATRHRGKDLSFSPDGRYYLRYEEGKHSLYDAQTEQDIPLPTVGVPDRWVPGGGHQLLLRKTLPRPAARDRYPTARVRVAGEPADVDYLVYDVESRQVGDSLRGRIPAWASPPSMLPFVSGARVTVLSRP